MAVRVYVHDHLWVLRPHISFANAESERLWAEQVMYRDRE